MPEKKGATRLKTVGDYIDDPHVTCLDTFSLNPVPVSHTPGPLEAFCQIPSDNPHREDPDTICLSPGLDAVDFYSSSERTEVWKNNTTLSPCWVPMALQGWEFFTILHPKPEGALSVVMNGTDGNGPPIELLFGRPPAAQCCPSMLFVIVPAGTSYQNPAETSSSGMGHGPPTRQKVPGRGKPVRTPYSYEMDSGNLDMNGRTIDPRLLALCPSGIYDDSAVLPDGASWGLFVGPRHRRLLLLNKTRGRIDVHLLMLFSMDAVFQRGRALIEATARLFEVFGTSELVPALFEDFDPLKAHCGFTNAIIADHVNGSLDGRDDYRRLLGVWPHSFFVSNNSNNMRFLTPLEVTHHRTGRDDDFTELPMPHKLEDFPMWVMGMRFCNPPKSGGLFEAEHRTEMRKYRTRVIPRGSPHQQTEQSWKGGMLQLLGLHGNGPNQESWSQMMSKLGGCAEVTFAGSQPWQEPGAGPGPALNAGAAGEEPSWLDSLAAPPAPEEHHDNGPSGIHWRHSQDLVPGADLNEYPLVPAAPATVLPPVPMQYGVSPPSAGPTTTEAPVATTTLAPVLGAVPEGYAFGIQPAVAHQPDRMTDAMACALPPPP